MNLRCTRRFLTLLWSAAAIALSGLIACGSPGNCDTFAADYCARIGECDPGVYAFLSGGDDTICQARLRPRCSQSLTIDGALATADKAGECGKAIRATTCEALLSGHLPDSCNPPGARAEGASCSTPLQCTTTRCTGSDMMCGTCVPRLKLGEPCQSSSQCQEGLLCNSAGSGTGTCGTFAQLGQPCGNGSTCLPTLFCDNGGQSSGTCAARRNAGEACTRNTDCDSLKMLSCETASKKCVAYTINYVDVGAPCPTAASTSFNICKRDAHCVTTTVTGGGTTTACVAASPSGQPCNGVDNACAAGLSCTNNVCQGPVAPLACK